MSHAGEMRHHGEMAFLAENFAHLSGSFAGAPARAISHGNEIGLDSLEGGCGGTKSLDAGVVLGREEFQGAQGAVLREKFGDRAVGRHFESTYDGMLICVKDRVPSGRHRVSLPYQFSCP